LRGVAPRIANVSGTSERIIAFNVALPSQSNFGKRGRHKFIQSVGYTRRNNKLLGPIMLKHQEACKICTVRAGNSHYQSGLWHYLVIRKKWGAACLRARSS